VCDLETSRMGAPYIYIYIYDISRLRVNYQLVRKNYSSLDLGTSYILLNPYITISPIPFDVIEESSLGA